MGEGGCGICRIVNLLVSLAFLGAAAYLIWHFVGEPDADDIKDAFGDGFGDFRDVLGNWSGFDFGDLFDSDPFLSDNSTSSWKTTGSGGLDLDILNALDDTWQDEFELAIYDWENGDPDALTLTVSRGDIDYECTQVTGLQKVCAGNYGETGWLGINEILKNTATQEIQSSVAKMNEYYLRNADNAERQYTMCHEIGHGFGLPHTDESFTNPSLGNCMDYTNKPEENMHPDETNYNRLASLYGTVGRRALRVTKPRKSSRPTRHLTAELRQEYQSAVAEFSQVHAHRVLSEKEDQFLWNPKQVGWRLTQEHSGGAIFSRQLGTDHTIEVHLLHKRQ